MERQLKNETNALASKCVKRVLSQLPRLITIIVMFPIVVSATKPKPTHQDAVIDRLEKKLLEYESSGVSSSESLLGNNDGTNSVEIQGGETTIKAVQPPQQRSSLDELEKVVKEIEDQIDQTEEQIQELRSELIQKSGQGGFINLSIDSQLDSDRTITQVTAKLDGFEIYSVSTSLNLWNPFNLIPLYSGPIPPGEHRLDLEVVLAQKSTDKTTVNGSETLLEKQSFQFSMPPGPQLRNWTIILKKPEKGGTRPVFAISDLEVKQGA